ncbi:MAG: GNAT family N-acetyltransferase [Bacteroidales bacterium]|nr:GNAT family N-acetyltransferase [Bacteroidales bacterium]
MIDTLPSNTLFAQNWWWDAVCPPEDWRVLQTENGSTWNIAVVRRLKLFKFYSMPPLTQHSGPCLADRQDFIKLLAKIPHRQSLSLNVNFNLNDNEIRFAREQGIQVIKKVTHRLEDLSDLNKVYHNVKAPRQRQIRKAERQLTAIQIDDIEPLIRLQKETFKRRGMKNPYPPQTVRRLYAAVKEHQAGCLIALVDQQHQIMACGLFVHDDKVCYSLTHGFHKLGQDVGAGSLLQWKGIEYAAERGLIFDFEGSNIEQIARFNLSFGASIRTYSCLERQDTVFRIGERLYNSLKRIL